MGSQIDQSILKLFEQELKLPFFSDADARIEFYTLAKGATKEIEEGLMGLLEKYRPTVARQIKEELERV